MKSIIKVLQIKDLTATNYAFFDFDLKKFSLNDYKEIYTFEAEFSTKSNDAIIEFLDRCFQKFNIGNKPIGYLGHSLSVSDIIKIDNDYYYCESFGWKKIN